MTGQLPMMSPATFAFLGHPGHHLQSFRIMPPRRCTFPRRGSLRASAVFSHYQVFVSHAGEDKTMIAFPLRDKLSEHGIKTFVDERDMPPGTWAEEAMTTAMETAEIAVVVLSPEFVARKWPMRELLCFLKRIEQPNEDGRILPVIIPLFYRLSIKESYDEPRLDRLDREDKSLYRASRFFERMDNGDPEANIANIKAALQKVHGAMGVTNYVNATNDSTKEMSKRRNVLLNDVCAAVRDSVSQLSDSASQNTTQDQNKGNEFVRHYHRVDDAFDLVLNFQSSDGVGNAATVETKVLQSVLDTSADANTISIQGIGGVGKTSILLGLLCLDAVKQRFKDGIHFISLGADATRNRLLEALCNAVSISGGRDIAEEMRTEENWMEVFTSFRTWFSRKTCLFLIDDIWQTSEMSPGLIHDLLNLHRSGRSAPTSRILFTTRSMEIASEAASCLILKPRDPLGSVCRSILVLNSGIEVDKSNAGDNSALCEILQRCGGLPLFLKIAGKAVKALGNRPNMKKSVAYRFYAQTLAMNVPSFYTTDVESHERLAITLSVSVQLLEHRKDRFGFPVRLSMTNMNRRLSVIAKQSRVPMTMLKHLWELRSEAEAAVVAREFEQIALATIYIEEVGSGYKELLGVHDSLHEYAAHETQQYGEEKLGHKTLLEGYGKGLRIDEECRAWWSARLEVDGYIHGNVCHHLASAGLVDELIHLLLKMEWTIRSFEECGILDLERDYSLGIAVMKKIEAQESEDQDLRHGRIGTASDTATALQMVSEAMRLSCGFNADSPRELCFQLQGRLKVFEDENVVIKKYLSRLEGKAAKLWGPWMRSVNSFLLPPGGATTNIHYLGSGVKIMTMSDDGGLVFCGCYDGRIVVLDIRSGIIVQQWPAHKLVLSTIALSKDGKLLFSGSRDGLVREWDWKTGTLLRMRKNHFGWLFSGCDVVISSRSHSSNGDMPLIVTGFSNGMVQVRDLESGRMLLEPSPVHSGPVSCMVPLPDGEHFVSGGRDNALRIWSITSGIQIGEPFIGHDDTVNCVSLMPDGRHIVSGSNDCTVRIWHIEKRAQVGKSLNQSEPVVCVTVSADGRRIASGSRGTTISVWDSQPGGEVRSTLKGHTRRVDQVLFHPIDNSVIACSIDGTVRVWDLRKANVDRSADRHNTAVKSVAFSFDAAYVVSASTDNTMRIWDANSGHQVGKQLIGHSSEVAAVAITPDHQRVVSVSWDKTIRIWSLITHELLHTFTGHSSFTSIALTPSGEQAVTTSLDGNVQVWDLETGKGDSFSLGERIPYHLWTPDVFVTDDGLKAVAASDIAVIAWNLETRQCIKTVDIRDRNLNILSRREVMELVGESTKETNTAPVSLRGREMWYVQGKERFLLGTLEALITCQAVSVEKKMVCAGLYDGHVCIMRLET